MRGRYQVLLAVLGVVVVVMAILFWSSPRPRGVFAAKYEGHTLTYWVEKYRSARESFHGDLPQMRKMAQEAEIAIRVLSSNNAPELARELKYISHAERDYSIKDSISRASDEPLADRPEERARAAETALFLLGPEAAPAIPELETLILGTNNHVAARAAELLPWLGTNSVPWLLTLMADDKHPRQAYASGIFRYMTQRLQTNTSAAALPVLLRGLQSTNLAVALAAADSLGEMQQQPEVCIPALTNALTNADSFFRMEVTNALDKFRQSARVAQSQGKKAP